MLPWLALTAAEWVSHRRWPVRLFASLLVTGGSLFALSGSLLRERAWDRPAWEHLGEVYRGLVRWTSS
jgi:hypothetical protein